MALALPLRIASNVSRSPDTTQPGSPPSRATVSTPFAMVRYQYSTSSPSRDIEAHDAVDDGHRALATAFSERLEQVGIQQCHRPRLLHSPWFQWDIPPST